jgi:hypothetical protein
MFSLEILDHIVCVKKYRERRGLLFGFVEILGVG